MPSNFGARLNWSIVGMSTAVILWRTDGHTKVAPENCREKTCRACESEVAGSREDADPKTSRRCETLRFRDRRRLHRRPLAKAGVKLRFIPAESLRLKNILKAAKKSIDAGLRRERRSSAR